MVVCVVCVIGYMYTYFLLCFYCNGKCTIKWQPFSYGSHIQAIALFAISHIQKNPVETHARGIVPWPSAIIIYNKSLQSTVTTSIWLQPSKNSLKVTLKRRRCLSGCSLCMNGWLGQPHCPQWLWIMCVCLLSDPQQISHSLFLSLL